MAEYNKDDEKNTLYMIYLDMVAELHEKLHENINIRFELNEIAPKNDKVGYAPAVDLVADDITPDSSDNELIAAKQDLISILYKLDEEIREFTAKIFFIQREKAADE